MARRKKEVQQTGSALLTRQEAAEYLGVSAQTLAIWKTTGRYALPVVKVGRLCKYKRTDLDRFLKGRTEGDVSASDQVHERANVGTKVTGDSSEREVFAKQLVEFAEVQLVERPDQKALDSVTAGATPTLEIIFPGGIKLRLNPSCPLSFLSSVIAALEDR